ncbi:MAG: HNH endonuclease signature motif containing protein [bacterium]
MKIKSLSIIAVLSLFILATPQAFAKYGVQTKTSHCIVSELPDPACSPGAVLTTNVKTICTVGYTKTVRDVSTATRKKVFSEYGIPYSQSSNYEVDHIISLELGGSNDISNLFPESYTIKDNARIKDVFENYLHKQVCNGSMTVTEAQKEISSDWLTYYNAKYNPTKTPIPKVIVPQITTQSVQSSFSTTDPAVKKSSTGLCHATGTTYYKQTTKFTAYTSIASCLASGGKMPAK